MTKAKTRQTSSSSDRTLAYAEAVLSGEIVAGPHVRNACRRHIDDLANAHERGLWFDAAAAKKVFEYYETVLKHSEGQFEGQSFSLDPSQCFILGSLFGWKNAAGFRRFRRAYIEQGKGNGKSPLVGGIGLYGLASDDEPGAQIYSAASQKDQATILFRDAVKMRNAAPALRSRLTASGGPGREFNLAHLKSGSFFRPISREAGKTGSGPRPHFALADEVHEMQDRGILEMLERGFKFRRQPLLVMITNSGTDRHSVCWEEHEHAVRVAAGNSDAKDDDAFYLGEPIDDTTFSYVCALDPGDDPLTQPSCWVKANPLLGVTITNEWLAAQVKQAKAMPGKLNGILRLHFCVWTDASRAWMGREPLEAVLEDFEPQHAPVSVGIDLSGTRDLTAMAFVQQTGANDRGDPMFDAWIEAWTPGETLAERELSDRVPYGLWVSNGFLRQCDGQNVRFDEVAAHLASVHADYGVRAVAYDRYSYRRFQEECDQLGLTFTHVEHPQGGKRRGKPVSETSEGLWMPGSIKALEALILERRIRIKRNPVLVSAMMSAETEADAWDNYWLSKRRAVNRIDAAVALAMAVGLAMANVNQSPSDISFAFV